jgi:tetratricopeptide (TPR) repeat protein
MSPSYNLDQAYSKQAIDEFQSFIEYHPTDSLVTDAEKKIGELNMKLAQKIFENGVTYMHMEYFKSAVASFDLVLEKYHDTPYAEQAQLRKAEAQLKRRPRLTSSLQSIPVVSGSQRRSASGGISYPDWKAHLVRRRILKRIHPVKVVQGVSDASTRCPESQRIPGADGADGSAHRHEPTRQPPRWPIDALD